MFETFLIKPFFALILIAISSSLLGVFVLWKKISYFGDALSHSILLGLALGLLFEVNQIFAVIFMAIFFAYLVGNFLQNRYFSKDIIVMAMSYLCVAMAVLINDYWQRNFNFSSYIFGDVLTVGNSEIIALGAISVVVVFFIFCSFSKLLLINLSEDLARIEGIKVELEKSFFMILLSLTIALSVQIVGAFLMTALLIFPAAIARIFCCNAKQMLIVSLLISLVVGALSFLIASQFGLTISSTIVATFSLIFFPFLKIKS